MADVAWLWIIGGINGAGKSSLAQQLRAKGALHVPQDATWFNPDDRVQQIRRTQPDLPLNALNYRAIIETDEEVDRCVERKRSCVVETVLTHEKHRKRLLRAHELGLHVGLFYVTLGNVDLAISRVAARVQRGGHDVPQETIRKRWDPSLDALAWFARQVDRLMVYLNTEEPTPIADGERGAIRCLDGCPDHVLSRLGP